MIDLMSLGFAKDLVSSRRRISILLLSAGAVIVGCVFTVAGRSPDAGVKMGSILRWTTSTPFPDPRSGYAAGVLDGKVVIAGGTYWEGTPAHWTRKLYSAITSAFDPISQKWEKLPSMPASLGYPASAVFDDKLYVMGGYTGHRVNQSIDVLRSKGGVYSWRLLREPAPARVFATAVTTGKAIYLVGGTTAFEAYDAAGTCCTSKTATNSLWVFQPNHPAKGWQQLPAYPGRARWLPAVVFARGSIWIFGGLYQAIPNGSPTFFRTVLRYDLHDNHWSAMPPLPASTTRMQPLTALTIQDGILLFTPRRQVWKFNFASRRYLEMTPMPEAVAVDKFLFLDHLIVGAGGESAIEEPRRRSQWTFIARLVPASSQ